MSDERSLDKAEQLIPLAEGAGMSLMHMALAFVVSRPALTAAITGPRAMEQLNGLLAGAEVVLNDELLDRIDEIVPSGVDVAPLEGRLTRRRRSRRRYRAVARSQSGGPPDVIA